MDFLKDIFGDKALTFDDFSKAVTEGKLQIADLSTGDYVSKEKHRRISDELSTIKKDKKTLEDKLGEIEGANLTADEKLQKVIDSANAEKKSFALALNKLEAEKICTKAGMTEEDYAELIDAFVSEDKDTTITRVSKFAQLHSDRVAELDKLKKSTQTQNTPGPMGGSGDNVIKEGSFGAELGKLEATQRQATQNSFNDLMKV